MKAFARRPPVAVLQLLLVLGVLAVLEVAPRLGWVDPLTLIPLSAMAAELAEMLRSGEIVPHLASTGSMVVMAFGLATVTGLAGGYVLWRWRPAFRMLDPYLTSYYALPIFAFYPVLIAVFGVNRIPIVLIAWAWAVVAVVVNTVAGLRHIPVTYHKIVRVYRLGRWQAFRRIYFPASAPFLWGGIKLAFSYSIIGVVASEFILAPRGLGWLVAYNYNNFGLPKMYAAILLVVVLTVTATLLLGLAERRVGNPGRER